jgi:thiamine kinase-like enzyme
LNAAEVLAEIPGWEAATVAPLDGGTTNSTLLADNGAQRAVLKIDAEPRRAPFNTRSQEARIQTMAAAAGLANAVIYASETVLLSEYAEGEVWSRATFDDADRLSALARTLREVHALPPSGRAFDALGAARSYARRIDGADAAIARDKLDIIARAPRPSKPSLCHNDLVAENILSAPGIRLLDWEYACDNDPLFDLATIVAHHRLPAPRADLLLDAYFEGSGERWRNRLRVYERSYEALLWLWQTARATSCS